MISTKALAKSSSNAVGYASRLNLNPFREIFMIHLLSGSPEVKVISVGSLYSLIFISEVVLPQFN